jgi:hypothetical protein
MAKINCGLLHLQPAWQTQTPAHHLGRTVSRRTHGAWHAGRRNITGEYYNYLAGINYIIIIYNNLNIFSGNAIAASGPFSAPHPS